MDNTDGDSILELNAPEGYYQITALLRDNERIAIEKIVSRLDGEPAPRCCPIRNLSTADYGTRSRA
jgi:fructose 1,6-bisphosphatase